MKKWTYESIMAEALKFDNRSDFATKSKNAYMAAWSRKILDEVCDHMEPRKTNWTNEGLFKEASKFSTRVEFKNANNGAYTTAINRGILDLVCEHMEYKITYWDIESLRLEAAKYNTRSEFQTFSRKAYSSAFTRGVLDDICKHMKSKQINWTEEDIRKAASRYRTKSEFQREDSKAYKSARRRGILDSVCDHMIQGISGFDVRKPAHLYVMSLKSSNEHYIGFGITNNINYRTKVHKMNANKSGFVANIVKLIYFSSGGDALLLERELKHTLPITNTKIIGFKTEAILAKDFNLLHKALGIYD